MLGILCGLESEAALARRIRGARVGCAGARPGKARVLAQELVKKGVKRIVSFGVAGALQPGLAIGTLVVGTHVASPNGMWPCDEGWSNALASKFPQAQKGGVWGSETLVPTAASKKMLYKQSGCMIVDMESQCAAEAAEAAKIPLAVVRAVCDTSAMNVPPAIMAAITEDGRVEISRAMRHILTHPMEIPGLFHVMRGINRALASLRETLPAF
jgi:hopanoid-associated phosphorylase